MHNRCPHGCNFGEPYCLEHVCTLCLPDLEHACKCAGLLIFALNQNITLGWQHPSSLHLEMLLIKAKQLLSTPKQTNTFSKLK